ncbi:hypothetical protein KQH56_00715 [bacterium]|nr:hypothetical protein [bacterium]
MSIELPSINAIVARLPNAEINLAAYGGVVFPIALFVEAPIINLLAASTALSRDWSSYQKLKKITLIMGGFLMGLHLLIALTPIFDFIVNVLLQAPPQVIEPARAGLLVLSPWTFAIAFRRFQQGAMIRHGHSEMVGQTTTVRLVTVAIVLIVGFSLKTIPGPILAGAAQALGVTAEAIFSGLRIRKIRHEIKAAPDAPNLTLKRFVAFYLPLALTSSLWLLWQPLVSAAVFRMPDPLESGAVWSIITGILFLFRSPGVAFNEVVVALLEEFKAIKGLRKFARNIALITTLIILVVVLTPLSQLWLKYVAALPPDLVETGRIALILGLPIGALSVYISYYQGMIVHNSRTGVVAEAVLSFLISMTAVLVLGIVMQSVKGVYIASAAFTLAHFTQAIWLMIRTRRQRKVLYTEL